MASRGRSLPALTKAWIAVSTSIGVLRLWAEASWDWSWCARQMLTYGAAVQRWLCRSSRQSVPCGLPIPGQQLVQPIDRRASRDHPLEHIHQIGVRVEIVQLRRVDQTGQDRPGPSPAVTASEECILPTKCNRPHGPFNRVRVHLDPPILQEHGETGPVAEHILDRLNQARPARKLDQGGHQPRFQSLQDRLRLGLPDGAPLGGAAAPDPRLDRINLAQGGNDVARKRGMGGLVDGDNLATGMGQTDRELDLGMTAGQPLVAAVPIDLENTFEALDLGGEIRHRASVSIDVSDRGWGRAAPRAIINGMAPELTAFGAPASRIEDRHRRLIGEHA